MRISTIIFCCFVFFAAIPARGESSFSALGYGLAIPTSSARSIGMGGVTLTLVDRLGLNLRSPAMWTGPPTARLGIVGGLTRTATEDDAGSDLSDLAGLGGVAFAVSIKSGSFLGVAVSPYTRMAYRWSVVDSDVEGWDHVTATQQGRGGLSQGLIGFSVPLGAGGKLGAGARALFGTIERQWRIEFPETASRTVSHTTSERYLGVGATVSSRFNVYRGWSAGFMVNSPIRLRVEERELILAGSSTQIDTTRTLDERFDVPLTIGAGLGYERGEHSAAVELEWTGWGSVNEPTALSAGFSDALRLSLGWEWQPEYRPFDSFWRAPAYRGGAYMQQHYVSSATGNRAIRMALTGGLGIPYNKNLSRVDLGLELGIMGDKADDGAAEKFIAVTIGVNHSERWFVKRGERR